MTTLLSLIIYTSITALTILAIMLIYNVIELFKWKWKIKYNYSNTEYEHKQVRQHKKKIIFLTPIMIILCVIILIYKAPVSFEKILGSKEYANSIKTLHIFRVSKGLSDKIKITDKKEINDIINTLKEYRYTRNLRESRLGNISRPLGGLGDKFISLAIEVQGKHYLKTLDITSSGSIHDSATGQAYIVNTENKEEFFDRLVLYPVTLSNNDLFPVTGRREFLRVKMIQGKYYEDWQPGPYMGTSWRGNFLIELADEQGNTIAKTDISEMFKEELIFTSSFQLEFDDYNNDGDLDFTIGQHASSNGGSYKLFTLRKSGRVEELPIKDQGSLFISKRTGIYSTKLEKLDKTSFRIEYYDNSKGKEFEKIYKWNGKEF